MQLPTMRVDTLVSELAGTTGVPTLRFPSNYDEHEFERYHLTAPFCPTSCCLRKTAIEMLCNAADKSHAESRNRQPHRGTPSLNFGLANFPATTLGSYWLDRVWAETYNTMNGHIAQTSATSAQEWELPRYWSAFVKGATIDSHSEGQFVLLMVDTDSEIGEVFVREERRRERRKLGSPRGSGAG
uniref:Uncharacterized protein n=1 Tax=Trichuris muris TaxID=70415 RepID=A0A5S6QF39_TRIMR